MHDDFEQAYVLRCHDKLHAYFLVCLPSRARACVESSNSKVSASLFANLIIVLKSILFVAG